MFKHITRCGDCFFNFLQSQNCDKHLVKQLLGTYVITLIPGKSVKQAYQVEK